MLDGLNSLDVLAGYNDRKVHTAGEKEQYIYFGGDYGTEKLSIRKAAKKDCMELAIQQFDAKSKKWIVEYKRDLPGWSDAGIVSGYWQHIERCIAVVYHCTRDGMLSYLVICRKRGRISLVLERHNVANGTIRLESGKLIEGRGNSYYQWVPYRYGFTLIKYENTAIPDALTIEYEITNSGDIRVPNNIFSIPAGTSIQLIRKGKGNAVDTVLISNTRLISPLEHPYSFRLNGRGHAEIVIIPDDNKDKAELIKIEAV